MKKIDELIEWIGSPNSLVFHTIFFACAFLAGYLQFATWDRVLLVLTTLVSLEAIYISIFIQMTVNRHTKSLSEVEEDIDDIGQEIKGIEKDVDDIQEDLEDITEDDEEDAVRRQKQTVVLDRITIDLQKLLTDIDALKERSK